MLWLVLPAGRRQSGSRDGIEQLNMFMLFFKPLLPIPSDLTENIICKERGKGLSWMA
jgi:hypothetical protein